MIPKFDGFLDFPKFSLTIFTANKVSAMPPNLGQSSEKIGCINKGKINRYFLGIHLLKDLLLINQLFC